MPPQYTLLLLPNLLLLTPKVLFALSKNIRLWAQTHALFSHFFLPSHRRYFLSVTQYGRSTTSTTHQFGFRAAVRNGFRLPGLEVLHENCRTGSSGRRRGGHWTITNGEEARPTEANDQDGTKRREWDLRDADAQLVICNKISKEAHLYQRRQV